MTQYRAPVTDLMFWLKEVVGLADVLPPDYGLEDAGTILTEAGRFAEGVLAPLNRSGDRRGAVLHEGRVDVSPGYADGWRQFVHAGWNSLSGSPEHGGQGFPTAVAAAVSEIWNGAGMAFALCPILTQGAAECLERVGSEALKARYLAPLIEGRWTGTMNLTEAQAGSDLAALRTKAERAGDHYRLTGQKIFITFGDHEMAENIIHLVLARLPDAPPGVKGISLFVVPKYRVQPDGSLGPRNDVQCVSLEHKLGIHGSPTAVMSFGDQEGAFGELVGEENRGLEYMFIMMNNARLNIGVQGIGVAERALQEATAFARTRVQGRPAGSKTIGPILGHPDVRRMLVNCRVRIEAARALALEAAVALDKGRSGSGDAHWLARGELLIPIVKAWSTDMGVSVASTALQVYGGMGYIEETGAAQHYRDARIAPIYEGTNGIQANDLLSRKLLRDRGEALALLILDVRDTLAALAAGTGDDLASLHQHLSAAVEAVETAANWLLQQDDMPVCLAAAVPFLELLGTTLGGWMLARGALAAQQKLYAGQDAGGFHEGKLIGARVFAENELVRTPGLALTVMSAGRSLLAYPADLL
jgi:alkylation response protein AidB-like acyl-CoA dehydrogenase